MTLIEVLAVLVIVFIFAAMLLPASHGGNKARRIACVNNLKQIGLAFRIWEGDNGNKFPMEISATNADAMKLIAGGKAYVLWEMMSNEFSTPQILWCPADTKYNIGTNFTIGFSDANISYFFGLDVTTNETPMLLVGDDNLAVNDVPARPGILTLWTNSPVVWTKNRHEGSGNIGLADGSVQQVTTHGLILAISNAAAPSRLVIP